MIARAGVQRVALLADSHGALDARVAALALGCDFVVHAGDVGSAAVLAQLAPVGALVAVRGNNDVTTKWPRGGGAVLDALPESASLELPGGRIVAVHGHRHGPPARRHLRLRRAFPAARCIVYGHSHRLCCDVDDVPWVINPGACGLARTFGGASCVVLTAAGDRWMLSVHRFAIVSSGRGNAAPPRWRRDFPAPSQAGAGPGEDGGA